MPQTQLASMFIGQTPDADVLAQRKKQPALIHILDAQTDEVRAVIGKDQPYWDDKHKVALKNNVETFDFHTLFNGVKNEHIKTDARIIIPDGSGYFREFIIDETFSTRDALEVYSTGSYNELKKAKPIAPATYTGATLNTMLDEVLLNTGWQRGITDYSGTQEITWDDYRSPFDALQLLPTIFDIELRFRVEQDGGNLYRFVDAVRKRGQDSGKEIVTGKDLLNVKRREHTKNQVTALLGIGPEKEDGSRLVVEVTDEDALQAWGRNGRHKWQVYEPESDRQDMTLEELTRYTRTELDKRKAAAVEYEVEAVDIEQVFGRSHEAVRIGDTARIKATEFEPPIYLDSRIIDVERSISDETQKTFVLGEFIEHSEEDINKLRKQLLGKIAGKTSIVYQTTPPGDTTVTWGDTSEGGGFKRYAADVGMWLPQANVTEEHTAKDVQTGAGKAVKEHGADVTGNNTANDTKYVNDRPAHTIEDVTGAQNKADQAQANAEQTARDYAVAKAVYDNKMQEIASDLSEKAGISYVDGELVSKANKNDTYTISEVDNALLNKVSVTKFNTDMNGVVQDLEANSTLIAQNQQDITLKADDTRVDTIEGTVSDNSAQLSVQADEIELRATQSDLDTVEGRVTSAESTISQQADEIELRVEEDNVISVINQTPELVRISASKLNLDGYTKFTDLSTEGQTTIHGGNLITNSMKWDVGRGGTMMLGGLNNGNGVFIVQDDEGENVAELDASTGGFQELRIGDVKSTSVVKTNFDDYTIEIDPANGDLWQDAINSTPKYNEGNVTIAIVGSNGNTSENVVIEGFVGSGKIIIVVQTSSRPKLDGTYRETRNQNRIYASGFDVNGTDSPCVFTNAVPGSQLDDVIVYGNGHSVAFENQNGATIYSDLQAYDVERCIRSSYASHLTLINCKGLGNTTGIEARFGGIITGYGTAPDSGQYPTFEGHGGRVLSSFTADAGSATPPPPPEQTKRFKATDAGAWRSSGGWVKSQPLQGEWSGYGPYKGAWIFDGLGAELQGKTIKRMRIYAKREAKGGYSSAVDVTFRHHNYDSLPSGEPFLSGSTKSNDFEWGEDKWTELPSSFYGSFEDGTAEGIGIYSGSSDYAYMSASATLEVTYQ